MAELSIASEIAAFRARMEMEKPAAKMIPCPYCGTDNGAVLNVHGEKWIACNCNQTRRTQRLTGGK